MAPIHDTDVAQERWSKAEWENYELWEKVELRLKRQKRLWIFATLVVFLILSAVPIVMDRWPKWMSRAAARHLAQEINQIKREASINRAAYRIKFVSEGDLKYVVEKISNCSVEKGDLIRASSIYPFSIQDSFTWISNVRGNNMHIPGLVNEFCYDYLTGSDPALRGESVVGFGIIPATDLTENRSDRLSILLLTGPSAEVSFD